MSLSKHCLYFLLTFKFKIWPPTVSFIYEISSVSKMATVNKKMKVDLRFQDRWKLDWLLDRGSHEGTAPGGNTALLSSF